MSLSGVDCGESGSALILRRLRCFGRKFTSSGAELFTPRTRGGSWERTDSVRNGRNLSRDGMRRTSHAWMTSESIGWNHLSRARVARQNDGNPTRPDELSCKEIWTVTELAASHADGFSLRQCWRRRLQPDFAFVRTGEDDCSLILRLSELTRFDAERF